MIHCIAPAAAVQGVAVGKENLGSLGPQKIYEPGSIIRAQIGKISRFPEMNLDGCEFSVKIDVLNPRSFYQADHFGHQITSRPGSQVSKVNFRFFHRVYLV